MLALTKQDPVYAALDEVTLGQERLDRAATSELLDGVLDQLPKQGKINIYSAPGVPGIHPDVLAEFHGFQSGDIMLFAMADARPIQEVIEGRVESAMLERHGDLLTEGDAVKAAIETLSNDTHAGIIALEVSFLKKSKVKASDVAKAAKVAIQDMLLSEVTVNRFLSAQTRWARKAGQLLRKGDRVAAGDAKFKQLLNYQIGRASCRERV